ncbi:acyltransferase [Acerihabitans sp. TG2]|uniref:acyltransferase n=1 Tax=Acerihabitans sp. TG2 TaxID=3096008 RepID=UPI002B233AC9|nr:acyltransferase [Acerihabitans sp. TG2]MEA9389296.1 acyltransferase [Acerihabitans sp. TG2]
MNILKRVYLKFIKKINGVLWARKMGVKVGNDCRLIDVTFSSEPYLVSIGNHVSATRVHFETHDGGVWIFRDNFPNWDIVGKIKIGNNVFIGHGVTILPGVTIGDNIVIGACSVVNKDLKSNAIYAGVPAKKIRDLDSYFEKCRVNSVETKFMTLHEKEKFLLNRL